MCVIWYVQCRDICQLGMLYKRGFVGLINIGVRHPSLWSWVHIHTTYIRLYISDYQIYVIVTRRQDVDATENALVQDIRDTRRIGKDVLFILKISFNPLCTASCVVSVFAFWMPNTRRFLSSPNSPDTAVATVQSLCEPLLRREAVNLASINSRRCHSCQRGTNR
jgi:hypothetical protein